MARPLEFDHAKARDKALLLFWKKGYQAASLAELLEAMRISRSSFYAAFGDKRSLFLACLDLFAERTRSLLLKAREQMAPFDALQFFFVHHLNGPAAHRASLGCLLVSTVLEMAGVDDELSDRASRHLAGMQRLFEGFLVEAGCAARRAETLASMLMLLNEGVRVASRRRLSTQEQLDPIETTFELLRRDITGPAIEISATH